jgi:exopolyphosphatase/pppGpp-phosphohydrolase
VSHQQGQLTVAIKNCAVTLSIDGGDSRELAVGPITLLEGPLDGADPPSAMHLTNALGMVQDRIDDIIIEDPTVATPTSVVATGEHAIALAHVEVGAHTLTPGYILTRSDADDLFRTLVAEPIAQRSFNPGLDEHYVASIIGTCCVILAIMRRLDLQEVAIELESPAAR